MQTLKEQENLGFLSQLNYKYNPIFDLSKQIYTACYCEENIFMLCKAFQKLLETN